jgi:hypothetical protein
MGVNKSGSPQGMDRRLGRPNRRRSRPNVGLATSSGQTVIMTGDPELRRVSSPGVVSRYIYPVCDVFLHGLFKWFAHR